MVEIQKPTVSENQKYYGNELYKYLRLFDSYHTKDDMCNAIGWNAEKMDRQLRDLISKMAQCKPIISTSDSRGYKLAQTKLDVPQAKHQINELKKRASEIQKRIAPLEEFIKRMEEMEYEQISINLNGSSN